MDHLSRGANAFTLSDFFICADAEGMRPSRLSDKIIEDFKEFLGVVLRGEQSYSEQIIKLQMNGMTNEIISLMNKTVEGKKNVKYAVYAGHDVTLTSLLVGLHAMNNSIEWTKTPLFAGNILFELDNSDGHPVSVYYQGELIHRESYATFMPKFAKVGELDMTWENACEHPVDLQPTYLRGSS